MGLDLFKDKKSLSSSSLLSGSGNVENIHQPRRLHVRLMQWPIGLILSKWRVLTYQLAQSSSKVNPQSVLLAIQHASDLSASIKINNVYIFTLSKQQY
ncbi:hypothetical protein NC653_041786 [Populus alba x Populus x berolinensis]|uniref:Uncharacterized protein n=1 Tax=Populus alba x Populus x berolinensis TaxID=444605 RepID=A0AAD6L9H4_9ROSI|nr:hypothetical protein NC653_041786 [Populus alba x Populus x berolinensis]